MWLAEMYFCLFLSFQIKVIKASCNWFNLWYHNTNHKPTPPKRANSHKKQLFFQTKAQLLCTSVDGFITFALWLSYFIPITKSHQVPVFKTEHTQFYGLLCYAFSCFSSVKNTSTSFKWHLHPRYIYSTWSQLTLHSQNIIHVH